MSASRADLRRIRNNIPIPTPISRAEHHKSELDQKNSFNNHKKQKKKKNRSDNKKLQHFNTPSVERSETENLCCVWWLLSNLHDARQAWTKILDQELRSLPPLPLGLREGGVFTYEEALKVYREQSPANLARHCITLRTWAAPLQLLRCQDLLNSPDTLDLPIFDDALALPRFLTDSATPENSKEICLMIPNCGRVGELCHALLEIDHELKPPEEFTKVMFRDWRFSLPPDLRHRRAWIYLPFFFFCHTCRISCCRVELTFDAVDLLPRLRSVVTAAQGHQSMSPEHQFFYDDPDVGCFPHSSLLLPRLIKKARLLPESEEGVIPQSLNPRLFLADLRCWHLMIIAAIYRQPSFPCMGQITLRVEVLLLQASQRDPFEIVSSMPLFFSDPKDDQSTI